MSGTIFSMADKDPGSLPGSPAFNTTAWTLVRGAQGADPAERVRALGQLIAVYWRPVFWTLRTDWNASPEDARDLTQEYFATFLEKRFLDDVDSGKGRFRSYVKATVRNFMLMNKRAKKAVKRGGRVRIEALEDLSRVEAEARNSEEPPDRRFDRDLMRSIIQESLARLEKECADAGHADRYGIFRDFYLGEQADAPPSYEELQARYKVGAHDVRNTLFRLRARFREIVLAFLRDGTSSEEDLLSEAKELFEA